MIARCPCGQVATHKVEIKVAPLGASVPAAREPGQQTNFRWGYFSADHIMTLADMQRQYQRAGLDVLSYEITELIQ